MLLLVQRVSRQHSTSTLIVSSFNQQRTSYFTLSHTYNPTSRLGTLVMSSSTLRQRAAAKSSAAPASPPSPSRTHSGHSHSHSHGGHSHGEEEATALLSALSGKTDPGSRITLIGLAANVGLTGVKGAAGLILGSAALLADAAHSGSDLLADIVTLTTYRMSRKPVSDSHPYGYGKYESLGSLVVSFLLIGTALGIGLHSYHLLLTTLSTMPHMNASILASLDALPHGHSHGGAEGSGDEAEIIDPRAMWFAAGSIVVKEWLYRATLKVAKQEHSNVLLANAFHHRSDAFGSLVAVGAIGGAWLGYPVLDPLGGLLVSGMILKQGAGVGITALKELTDQITDPTLPPRVHSLVASLRDPTLPPLPPFTTPSSTSLLSAPSSPTSPSAPPLPSSTGALPILSIPSIRIFASGPSLLLDIQLVLPSGLTLREANRVEREVREKVVEELGGQRVSEVVVRLVGEGEEVDTE